MFDTNPKSKRVKFDQFRVQNMFEVCVSDTMLLTVSIVVSTTVSTAVHLNLAIAIAVARTVNNLVKINKIVRKGMPWMFSPCSSLV